MFDTPTLTLILVILILLVLFHKHESLMMPDDDPDCPVGYYVVGGNDQYHICTSGAPRRPLLVPAH